METSLKNFTEILSLSIKADAIKAEIEAMKAENDCVDIHYNSPPWAGDAFRKASYDLDDIAEKIRNICFDENNCSENHRIFSDKNDICSICGKPLNEDF